LQISHSSIVTPARLVLLISRSAKAKHLGISTGDGGPGSSRLVATAAEDGLSISRNQHKSFAAASDYRDSSAYAPRALLMKIA